MATAGTIVFEIKITVDIVLAEDGKRRRKHHEGGRDA